MPRTPALAPGHGQFAKAPGGGKPAPDGDAAAARTPASSAAGATHPRAPRRRPVMPARPPGPRPRRVAAPAKPAPRQGRARWWRRRHLPIIEAQKQAVKEQAERKRAEVTEATPAHRGHRERAGAGRAPDQVRRCQDRGPGREGAPGRSSAITPRPRPRPSASPRRSPAPVSRRRSRAAETQEVSELTSGKDGAIQEPPGRRSTTRRPASPPSTRRSWPRSTPRLATSEQESATKLGEQAEALRVNTRDRAKRSSRPTTRRARPRTSRPPRASATPSSRRARARRTTPASAVRPTPSP